jgi:type VI secretion system secreted protein Hcp
MYNVLVNNENITEWTLQFWSPVQLDPTRSGHAGALGSEFQHFTVKLTNANIASIGFRMLNNKNPELMRFAEFEEIAFTYQKIEWTWMKGGITAMDDWEANIAS